jgi:drug/metabolite transporter (DMT)-like permease
VAGLDVISPGTYIILQCDFISREGVDSLAGNRNSKVEASLLKGYLLVFTAIVLFSTIEVVSKYLQEGYGAAVQVGPFQVATIRFVLGALLLMPLALTPGRRKLLAKALGSHSTALLILGVVGVFLTFLLFHWSIDMADASTVAVVISTTPVFTAAMAWLFLKERLSALNWLGVAIGLAGAVIAATELQVADIFRSSDVRGGLLSLAANLTWSLYTVLGKRYSEEYGGLAFSAITMSVGAMAFAAFLALRGGWVQVAGYNAVSWLWLVYLGVVATGVGYYFYFGGLRSVPASRGASMFYFKPVIALVLAFFLLGEEITPVLLVAAFLCAGGVILVTYRGRDKAVSGRVEYPE